MRSLLAFLFISASFLANANVMVDEPVPAIITSELQIVLPVDQPLAEIYVIDISGIAFENEAEAKQFFGMFTENVVRYTVNYAEMTVEVKLQNVMTPAWNLSNWNEYFAGRSAKMQAVFATL
jgi:hypothetical protein